MSSSFIMPGKIISGDGALVSEASKKAISSSGKKALIVTDPMMKELGNCSKVEDLLDNLNICYVIYSEIVGEPNDTMIEKGVQVYKLNIKEAK